MSPFIGEILGTMILIIFGGGVVANVNLQDSKAQGGGWIVVALGWGLGVTMAVYAAGQVSGAHINPAVTLGLAAIGDFPWSDVPGYITAQMIGAFLGGCIVYFHFLPHFRKEEDKALKLAVFSTDPAIPHTFSNFLSEFIGTAMLLIGLLAIGSNEFTEGLNPFIVGFLIVAIGLSLGGTTGYAINPARDLGPRIAHFFLPIPGKGGSNWQYAWIPVVGPVAGGMYGAVFYKAVTEASYSTLFWIWTVAVAVLLFGLYQMGDKLQDSVKATSRAKN
ncbi:MIP/aquaporin family protein [Pseudalkalibacillus hwajinpoensis]|uniref:Aquaporin family protein n=1 Tax=Guptibacillus hwajinpoensis TaxID=208199 RepID=A0A4U1MK96_9BACL|nr:MIP/aquaporin family protein [Pseudalkalibacillus hwajinpoensis]TKD71005.1 aquaporin family protein [Pseudalkalibacillus hwajinpoensis]